MLRLYVQAGGQLVDQRFCPRIVEGELRYNLVPRLQLTVVAYDL